MEGDWRDKGMATGADLSSGNSGVRTSGGNADPPVPRLRMAGVGKRFGPTVALAGVDLHVHAGEVVALVGENGAGKSTLMKVLAGAHAPDQGAMFLDGAPYRPANPLEARRAGVAMIYQELAQAPDLSVAENILLGAEPSAGPMLRWSEMRRISRDALSQVGLGHVNPDMPISRLSVAHRQLVEIARAVAVGCRVLVLDEPTSSLTQQDIATLFTLVRKLQVQGHAIVYISHFLEEVREICQRFVVLRDGASVGGGMVRECTNRQIVSLMVGRSVDDLYPRSRREAGEVILDVHKLAGTVRPREASLAVRRGEVVGVAGLVGAGRTEFLRAVFGLDAVRSGEVKVASLAGAASPAQRWAQGVGMVSEDRKTEGLAQGMSIADNVTMASHRMLVSPARMAAETRSWIVRLGIRCRHPGQPVSDLSGGNQQKVAVARLLHHGVDLLLLDEPTRGIDIGAKAQIYRLIDELACAGKAVLLVSSYLPELLGICDRIAVMCRGRLGPARPVGECTEHQIILEATGAGL
jgi:ribose transport system ATP-binding protein